MRSSVVIAALSAAVSLVLLAGCAPEPEPEPAWTEEEAYAAAEETFRAYISESALSNTEGHPERYVTGALADQVEEWEERTSGVEIAARGESRVVTFEAVSFDVVERAVAVSAEACIDSSDVEVRDSDGKWTQTRPNGAYVVRVDFVSVGDAVQLAELSEVDLAC
ncbi:hypothetical protein [Microbacterium excoecariae]|uniref:hypothetical protein n=1 Tax=Microbacterium excoecariae TaxID=2715210 RepID=UPI001407E58E|nr:hypothetical protein [Microbacterium excoecariae]NHI16731.1 hypothetical protein [Microbacterium excoecariae]